MQDDCIRGTCHRRACHSVFSLFHPVFARCSHTRSLSFPILIVSSRVCKMIAYAGLVIAELVIPHSHCFTRVCKMIAYAELVLSFSHCFIPRLQDDCIRGACHSPFSLFHSACAR